MRRTDGTKTTPTAAQTLTKTNSTSNPTPEATGTDGTSTTSTSSAAISANDFLTLLVTEMQNQDPTANTDPNEYINQLVQVNSLEQLIGINQTLTTDLGPAPSSAPKSPTGHTAGATNDVAGANAPAETAAPHRAGAAPAAASTVPAAGTQTTAARHTAGNVGVPSVNPAAQQVGQALSGRTHSRPAKGSAIPLQ